MTTIEFPFGSELYQRTLEHRDHHLREPLGLQLDAVDTKGESDDRHFALMADESIVGGIIARPTEDHSFRFRQMWIEPSLEGRGHGRTLLHFAENILAKEGASRFTLHARETARGFYAKCGYQAVGETFLEIGIPHVLMSKPASR